MMKFVVAGLLLCLLAFLLDRAEFVVAGLLGLIAFFIGRASTRYAALQGVLGSALMGVCVGVLTGVGLWGFVAGAKAGCVTFAFFAVSDVFLDYLRRQIPLFFLNPAFNVLLQSMRLSDACFLGRVNMARLWLFLGADVTWADPNINGFTPLYFACFNGHVATARLCLDRGADIDLPSVPGGCTPLWVACKNGHLDVVRLLIDRGADINWRPATGASPLYAACENNHLAAAELLLDRGATGQRGISTWLACQNGRVDAARLLLDRGADPNVDD